MLFESLESCSCKRAALIDAVNLDAVAGLRDVEAPVPCVADFDGLGVEGVVPGACEY